MAQRYFWLLQSIGAIAHRGKNNRPIYAFRDELENTWLFCGCSFCKARKLTGHRDVLKSGIVKMWCWACQMYRRHYVGCKTGRYRPGAGTGPGRTERALRYRPH